MKPKNKNFQIEDINKYHLTLKNIPKLKVDRSKISEKDFWYNNVINAWCISGIRGRDEYPICDADEYWLGIYDKPKKNGKVKIECDFTAFSGMYSYTFDKFFDPKEIESYDDYMIQHDFIEKMNSLIEKGVFIIPEKFK